MLAFVSLSYSLTFCNDISAANKRGSSSLPKIMYYWGNNVSVSLLSIKNDSLLLMTKRPYFTFYFCLCTTGKTFGQAWSSRILEWRGVHC